MPHLDEGTIHAWLDGALSEEEAATAAAHVARCTSCAAAVAEARGLIAASSRILTALDVVPGDVIPTTSTKPTSDIRLWFRRPAFRATAAMAAAAVGIFWIVRETQTLPTPATSVTANSVVESTSIASAPLASSSIEQQDAATANATQGSMDAAPARTSSPDPLSGSTLQARSAPQSSEMQKGARSSEDRSVSEKRVASDSDSTLSTKVSAAKATQAERAEVSEKVFSGKGVAGGVAKGVVGGMSPDRSIIDKASPDSPVLLQSHACEKILVRVYSIGRIKEESKTITLIDVPDSISVREPRPSLKSQLSTRPRKAADLERYGLTNFLVPGLAHCSSEVKLFAQHNSAANLLRWTDTERKRAYVLQGTVPKDTLTLVRRALTKLYESQRDTLKK